jgi:RES domain-containing protein
MKLYRIARAQFINDLTVTGAKLFVCRSNHKGSFTLYTTETRSLATL